MTTPIQIVEAWQRAANEQDAERLLILSDPMIVIVGPRGEAQGHEILRDWLGRAGLQLTTQRIFARAEVVVMAQHGVWRSPATSEVIGEADVASLLRVAQGRVCYFARYDALEDALAAAGLSESDEVVRS